MAKYISIDDFKLVVGKIVEDVRDEVNKRSGLPSGLVHVATSVLKDGKTVEWGHHSIVGLTLSDDAPKIYEIGDDKKVSTVSVRVVFNVEEIHTEKATPLNLTEESYTFNTYKEYLEFFTKKFEEAFPEVTQVLTIWGLFKGSGISVPTSLARREYKGTEDVIISASDFASLCAYEVLPDAIRSKVDKDFCPFTVQREDVNWSIVTRNITVYINKPDMVEEQFGTHRYDDIVKNVIGKMTV